MINDKIIINGQEIKLPSEMMNMVSGLMPMLNLIPAPTDTSPKPQMPLSRPQIQCAPLPIKVKQHVVHNFVNNKDVEARGVIIEMNQRLKRLEERLNRLEDVLIQKHIKDKTDAKKTISKPKETPKPKGKPKVKSKVTKKKIGTKK